MKGTVPDTSPKIAEYGKYCGRHYSNDENAIGTSADYCYTEWYDFMPSQLGVVKIVNNTTNSNHVFQAEGENTDGTPYYVWYYGNQNIGKSTATLTRIRFSIRTANIDNAYAYCETTGQIFFAGKNSSYYGYRNINDMPN